MKYNNFVFLREGEQLLSENLEDITLPEVLYQGEWENKTAHYL